MTGGDCARLNRTVGDDNRSSQQNPTVPSTELAANLFRATQAEEILRREQVQGKEAANRTHQEVGRAVRRTIVEIGGTLPEDLPTPEKSVQQLRKEHEQQRALERQPALFEEIVPEE